MQAAVHHKDQHFAWHSQVHKNCSFSFWWPVKTLFTPGRLAYRPRQCSTKQADRPLDFVHRWMPLWRLMETVLTLNFSRHKSCSLPESHASTRRPPTLHLDTTIGTPYIRHWPSDTCKVTCCGSVERHSTQATVLNNGGRVHEGYKPSPPPYHDFFSGGPEDIRVKTRVLPRLEKQRTMDLGFNMSAYCELHFPSHQCCRLFCCPICRSV